ncbi:hypothetical protein PTSG_01452 [Salpingoeca rosetta]|uniref:Amine oxidase domain-containing protein n=1 Tax=Salpingoeca rosetta (strain ATCC 50818 / BSB-021) TaxID=946362 RepID=F2U0D8_SALR5|nr:uncharacterized protein PTSG_01452 [Salpingoeca rosetta]EGD80866.1 hypothetical protein PTSG_01452 [Salpingoeca rosetta]|eukprot:XP_004997427.1 hypothetical protein PTSG_01452 [Salpingoeca rosetta]
MCQYPNLLRFYEQHHVPLQATDMGFSIDNPTISWCLSSSLPQQLQLLRHPKLPSFVKDKTRFHSDALAFLERYRDADAATAPALSLLEFCTKHGYGAAFMEGWLKPFCEAVWSAPKSEAMAMDAYSILAFLRNHGFLTWSTPQWYTPRGRTTLTLKLFRHLFEHLGVEVHTANPVHAVRRQEDGTVAVTSETQGERVFDDVVLATPSGLALELLEAPTQDDVDALSGFKCSSNTVLLHTNPDLMPRDRALWSSWNVIEREETGDRPLLTYWVKPLQHIKSDNVFISLNPPAYMLEHKQRRRDVLMEWRTQHPMMTVDALRCQRRVHEHHQGKGGVWYAGAYLHYGFHEDGFRSGIEVARTLLKDTSIPLLPISGDAFHPTHFLLKGSTTHVRFNPSTGKVVHSFRYPLEYHCINVDAGFQTWWGGLFRRDYFGDQANCGLVICV